MTFRTLLAAAAAAGCMALGACATAPTPFDYSAFKAEAPHSIVVVPALNNTANVTAPDWFLSTISQPFANRGYYVFPANMVRGLLNDNGLADAGLVHKTDARRLQPLFGCDTVLFIQINKWDAKYVLISTTTEVEFSYELRSCKTNATLWKNTQSLQYTPQGANSGNPIAALIADAIIAAIEKGHPNYMPLARQANLAAAATPGLGLPVGPYAAATH
ncbi:MAG TPA: GNA1162 family protein [Caulobacteraceae bacterium]|jgi:hypothetical protein|nr:GNA1162 family protein [Caulobacteraceae bacterium]